MSPEPFVIAVYLRVSTRHQETKSQRQAIERWIRERGYPEAQIDWYRDEGISGRTTDRQGYQAMLDAVMKGRIHKIITFELSRLSRNFLDLLNVMRTLTDLGVQVEVPGNGVLRFDDTMSQFMIAANGLVAAQESELKSKRIKEGLRQTRKTGMTKRGSKYGAHLLGNSFRTGKTKNYNAKDIDKLLNLSKKLTQKELAEAMSWSVSKVRRVLKKVS